MVIKKFQAKTEEEAVVAAKKELGENIVIMNVRQLKRKGLLAFLKSQMVEVTVALEEDRENVGQKKQVSVEEPKEERPKEKTNTDALEEKLDSLQSLLVQQMSRKEAVQEDVKPAEQEPVKKEEIKEKELTENDKFIRLLYNTMLENEVDEKYANQILEEAEKMQKPNLPFDYVLAGVYQKMILKFGQAEEIKPAGKKPKVVAFIGPTGVGKTTTIAKLASSFCVEKKQKIALLTADTYRIAAAEQLRTYANILKVPFRIIYTKEDLETAIRDFSEYDYIFLDTAGHSHRNQELRSDMEELLKVIEKLAEMEVFLVLSVTTKYKDLLQIADIYKEFCDYKLIFTKLDETDCYGNLLNLKLHAQTALSYVTYGQNVPDDMEVFNPQSTVKQLLGGKKGV